MLWNKKLLRIAAALAVAIASAHTAEKLRAPAVEQPVLMSTVDRASDPSRNAAASAIPDSASLSARSEAGLGTLVGITSVAGTVPTSGDGSCRPELALAPLPGAMIQATLSAPCKGGERIVIRHSGLSFSIMIRPDGSASAALPALKTEAMVAVYFQDSQLVLSKVHVPDAAQYGRYAIVWESPMEMELRVVDGDKVLVGTQDHANGSEQRVMALGQANGAAPVLARVYSVPGKSLGAAEISAELRITPATCGRTMRVETVHAVDGSVIHEEQSIAVPLCGTSGDILVLKNLSPAVKIAAP